MSKYLATLAGMALAVAFVIVFFAGRDSAEPLTRVAPRVGMSYDALMAMGPRVATATGVTLGTSRHVIYLLACSGMADTSNFESQATEAGRLARERSLSDREAVLAVLARSRPAPPGLESLKSC